jgi:protein required for attachment to host cells
MIHALVADTRSIRVFEASHGTGPAEVAVLRNPDAGHHKRDLVSDRPGRAINSRSGQRQAYEPRTNPMQHAMQVWLKQIGPSLSQLIDSRQGEAVVLVAAPRMLASLRKSLPATLRKRVKREVGLDLARANVASLKKRLGPAMAAAARRTR